MRENIYITPSKEIYRYPEPITLKRFRVVAKISLNLVKSTEDWSSLLFPYLTGVNIPTGTLRQGIRVSILVIIERLTTGKLKLNTDTGGESNKITRLSTKVSTK